MPPETLAMMDDVRPLAKQCALGTFLFVLGAAGLPATMIWGDNYWAAWLLVVILLVVGGGTLAVTVPRILRRHTPFLVMTPEGFRCPGLAGPPVPWAAVDYGRVSGEAGTLVTSFVLKPDAPLPERDRTRFNVKVSRRNRSVSIAGPSPRGMEPEEYGMQIAARIAAANGLTLDEPEPVSRTP